MLRAWKQSKMSNRIPWLGDWVKIIKKKGRGAEITLGQKTTFQINPRAACTEKQALYIILVSIFSTNLC